MTISERVHTLREQMKKEGIDTYMITKFDPHQSEYAPPYWNGVRYISGFTGSAGTVVITQEKAGLWTDGRYYIQAERELSGSGIELYRAADRGVVSYIQFARDETPVGGAVGFDGRTMSLAQTRRIITKIKSKNITLKTDTDLIGRSWDDRPEVSENPIYDHDIRFCGKSRSEKLTELRAKMKEEGGSVYVISSLDDIAWLYNLRGSDIKNVTTFASYAVVTEKEAFLFIDSGKAKDVSPELQKDGISIKPYEAVSDFLTAFHEGTVFMLNPAKTSYVLYTAIEKQNIIELEHDVTTKMKAVKNTVELENLERTHIREGVVMVRMIKWVKENAANGSLTECDVDTKLAELRRGGDNYLFPSFGTIAAYMSNAAMAHYSASPENCAAIKPDGILLVDTGGNYLDGTTDITRTIALGNISPEIKKDFTIVLKSHIALARAIFLWGAVGANLDMLARAPMWANGINFNHGTGHGIGFCLNVHEGPQSIGMKSASVSFEPGMIISNEPGIYREGKHGIRTENIVLVKEHSQTEFGKFLSLDTISYCPIDIQAIDMGLLENEEKEWLNSYHKTVRDKLTPHLTEEEAAWLAENTKSIA